MLIDHLILGPVDVALQEVAEVRVVVCLSLVPPEKTGDLVLLGVLSVKYKFTQLLYCCSMFRVNAPR